MTIVPVITSGGMVTAWCGSCTLHVIADVDPVIADGTVVAVELTCPCGERTTIKRVQPDEAIATLAEPDMQDARAVRDHSAPGEWTIAVAVMWHAIDTSGWDHERRRRHRETTERWPETCN